jgi:Contractile injection system tube protein
MGPRGTLEKLLILAYEKPDYSDPSPVGRFTALLNPNEITVAYEIDYNATQGAGATNSRMNFAKVKPGDLSLSFFLDGTGANGTAINVQAKVAEFQQVTGYSGNIHRPHYLKVTWGTLPVRRCVLKSASIAYKLFKPNGVPLRAVITATFTENSDDQTRVAQARDRSPDLTHLRVVKAGDNLPAMCFRIYGDPRYYLEVARANRLDNFRTLEPGSRICFPPLKR